MPVAAVSDPDAGATGPAAPSRRIWMTAAAIAALAVAIRLAYFWTVPWRGANLVAVDIDDYTTQALLLARRHFAFGALFRAVAVYQFVRPPLYTVFLALISELPGNFLGHAGIAHALLGGAMVFAMFWIGWRLHSTRAGAIAALLGAVYWPFAAGANVFVQEALYIPLLMIAFAALIEASARQAPPRVWSAAGAVLGLAALTRSMPVYYLGPALALHVWQSDDRRRALRQAGGCLLAFALVIAPYSIAVSRHVHQVVVVENMGSISFPMRYPGARNAVHHTAPPPTVIETAVMLTRTFAAHPLRFTGERLSDALMLVRLRDGRTIQTLDGIRTAAGARAYKRLLITFDDGLLAVVCILAPFGCALARHRRESALLTVWIVLNVALLAAFTFTSARYRTPSVPAAMVFAGVALAGGWTRPSKIAIALAALVSAAIAWEVAGAVPSLLAGRAEYGLQSQADDGVTRRVTAIDAAGLNLLPARGLVEATVQVPSDLPAADSPVQVEARLDGVKLETWTMNPGATRTVRYVWSRDERPYLELRVSGPSGHPIPFAVEVPLGLPHHGD